MLKTNPFKIRALILLFFCVQTSISSSQEMIKVNYFDQLQDEYIIDQNLYILEDAECILDLEKSISSSSNLNFTNYGKSKDLNLQSCHWIHFKIKSSAGFNHFFKDWKLSIGDPDFASIYVVDHLGEIVIHKKFWEMVSKFKKR